MRRAFLLLVAIVIAFPMYWLFSGSFRDNYGLFAVPPHLLPTAPTTANYAYVLQTEGLARWVLNSIIITAMAVAGNLFVSFTGGWFLAMNRVWLGPVIVGLLLASLMVPRQTLLIPLFVEMRQLHLVDVHFGAVMPLLFSPVSVLFARNWLRSAPKVYWEDAQIQGARGWMLARHIILPLCAPVAGFVFLVTGTAALSDYLWQSLILQSPEKQSAYVGMMIQIQQAASLRLPNTQGRQLAISVLMLVPLLAVGLLSQRQFRDNMARGIAE